MNEIKASFIKTLIFWGIFTLIDILWRLCDIAEFGQPMPSVSDTIVGTVLALSIYFNLHISVSTKREEATK